MKKKIIPFLFSLSLLASCGTKPCETHDYGEFTTTKEATCKEAGSKERECKVCGEKDVQEIAKLTTHSFGEWSITKNAACGVEGSKERVCSVCGEKETEAITALEHDYEDAADQTGAKAATCKETGTVITECKICHNKSTRVLAKTENHDWGQWSEVTPPTHAAKGVKERVCSICGKKETGDIDKTPDHTFGETPVHFEADHDLSGYDVYTCATDNVRKVIWDAKDVSPNTKNVKYNDEDNYKLDGEGVKFGGRPIGNACSLPASSPNPVFDEKVPGSFLEYNINLKSGISNAQLIANMRPAQWLDSNGGLFVSVPGVDWTQGYVADASAEQGYKATEFRYVIEVNGARVDMDASKNIKGNDATQQGWYNFPCTIDLNPGVNKIKLIQAGGWEATFFNFGVISAEGVEDVVADAAKGFEVKVTGDSHVTGIQFFEDKACTIEDNAEKHYSRNDMGRLLDNEDGQVSFAVTVADGYQVKEVVQTSPTAKSYKNIKNPLDTTADNGRNDVYRITKISADCEFSIVTEEVGATVYEGFEFTFVLGEHISSIQIYNSKTCNPDTLVSGLVATSIHKSTFKPTKDVDNAQIYLKIFCENGFEVDTANITWSTETKPFNKFEAESDGGENAYKFTKVNATATITLVAKAVVA